MKVYIDIADSVKKWTSLFNT